MQQIGNNANPNNNKTAKRNESEDKNNRLYNNNTYNNKNNKRGDNKSDNDSSRNDKGNNKRNINRNNDIEWPQDISNAWIFGVPSAASRLIQVHRARFANNVCNIKAI
jgi:hypothetical protein